MQYLYIFLQLQCYWINQQQIKPTKKRQKDKNTGIDTEYEGSWRQHLSSRAGRVQREEGGSVGGARITVTATTVKRRRVLRELHVERTEEEEEGKRHRGVRQWEGLEKKIRNPQRLEQQDTGGEQKIQLKKVRPARGHFCKWDRYITL